MTQPRPSRERIEEIRKAVGNDEPAMIDELFAEIYALTEQVIAFEKEKNSFEYERTNSQLRELVEQLTKERDHFRDRHQALKVGLEKIRCASVALRSKFAYDQAHLTITADDLAATPEKGDE